MYISKNLKWFGLRGCLYCGSLFRYSDGLCNVCSQELWLSQSSNGELFNQRVRKLEVISLFHWIPGRQEVLSRVIHALKGKNGEEFWSIYAEEFQRRRIPEQVPFHPRSLLFVPSPSKMKSIDHAWIFANALLRECGGEFCDCLRRESSTNQQKKKSRSQRQQTRIGWAENFTKQDFMKFSAGKHVIFVDDVVTTGSTARAAWLNMGKPRDFSIWALAQRGLSCGDSRSLL